MFSSVHKKGKILLWQVITISEQSWKNSPLMQKLMERDRQRAAKVIKKYKEQLKTASFVGNKTKETYEPTDLELLVLEFLKQQIFNGGDSKDIPLDSSE